MIKVFKKTVKCPIGWKEQGNFKATVISNEKVVVEIINKVYGISQQTKEFMALLILPTSLYH